MRRSFPCPIKSPERIAYIACGGIGDIIMAWPAVDMIRRSFPDVPFKLFVPEKTCQVIRAAFSGIDVSRHDSTRPITGFLNRGYDVALSNTVAAFYLAAECNSFMLARYSYGFRYPDEKARGRLYNETIAIEDSVHDIDQNMRLAAQALGIPFKPDAAFAGRTDHTHGPVIIHPGAQKGYEYKLWPTDRFIALCEKLVAARQDVRVLLGPSETHLENVFSALTGVKIISGPTAEILVGEIRRASLFIGNDSGPAHIAAFFNIPGITLIGPVDPARTAPRGPNSVVIYNSLNCSPCFFKSQDCPDNRCMKSITVDQVWEEVQKQLMGLRRN
jgi:ADP-heptose:LPS heptosyltransferase